MNSSFFDAINKLNPESQVRYKELARISNVLGELDDFHSFCELYIAAASGLRSVNEVAEADDDGSTRSTDVAANSSPLRMAFQEFDIDGDGALSLDGEPSALFSNAPCTFHAAKIIKSVDSNCHAVFVDDLV